jgi:Skp family chaperone for outer membrane proteins
MFLKKLIPGVLLFSLLGGSALAQGRVATVDTLKVFDSYWKTKQANAVLKDQLAEVEKADKEMTDGWKKAKEDYQKLLADANDQAVSADERNKRKKAAEDKLKDIKDTEDNITQFERQAHTRLNEQKARMRKNILDEIKLTVNSKAKAGNYSLVIDSGGQTYVADPAGPYYTPSVLYNNNENDLTEEVIKQLNAGAPVETPKAEEKQEEPKAGKK